MSVLIGLTATLAPTIGPTLGGWLTDQFSWHWLFLINVPVGVVVAACGVDLPRHRPAGLVAAPQLRPVRAGADGGVPRRAGIRAGGRRPLGLVPGRNHRLVRRDLGGRRRAVLLAHADAARSAGGTARIRQRQLRIRLACSASCWALGLYGSVYLVPLFLGRVRGYDSLQIGETMFVTGAAMFLSAPIAGQLARRMDLRVMLAVGLVMFGGGLWWMAHLTGQLGVLGAVRAAGAARCVDDVRSCCRSTRSRSAGCRRRR